MQKQNYIAILGAGESGVGAALLAKAKGYEVFVSDLGKIQANFRTELEAAGIAFESGQHTEEKILSAQLVIKSPGIPDEVPLVQKLLSKGIAVISEIEWAARFYSGTTVGITGSNGKTTTATLTHHLLVTSGLDAELAGNVGTSFARSLLAENQAAIYVLELSSFQLDGIQDFRPNIGALLNVSPDHLDRYDNDFEQYLNSKYRLTMNQEDEDLFIYFHGDEASRKGLQRHEVRAKRLGLNDKQLIDGKLYTTQGQLFDLKKTRLLGKHNARNALFALEIASRLGAEREALQAGLMTYQTPAHRLEVVEVIDGVRYINDSKATNVDAVYYALEAMDGPTIWIAGGTDKGNDYEVLKSLVGQKVKALIGLGVDNSPLKASFESLVGQWEESQSAAEAVQMAKQIAQMGDTVLLSPACASFDLFKNYIDRGDQFRIAVKSLKH